MTKYVDNKNEKIQKGFYKFYNSNKLFYFTGKYDDFGFPIFEEENDVAKKANLSDFLIRKLYKVNKKEIETKIKDLKEKINWLEKGLQD